MGIVANVHGKYVGNMGICGEIWEMWGNLGNVGTCGESAWVDGLNVSMSSVIGNVGYRMHA